LLHQRQCLRIIGAIRTKIMQAEFVFAEDISIDAVDRN
jgi:hypothetical protein